MRLTLKSPVRSAVGGRRRRLLQCQLCDSGDTGNATSVTDSYGPLGARANETIGDIYVRRGAMNIPTPYTLLIDTYFRTINFTILSGPAPKAVSCFLAMNAVYDNISLEKCSFGTYGVAKAADPSVASQPVISCPVVGGMYFE